MKTQEEIKKIAEELYQVSPNPKQMIEQYERGAFIKGYIKCQEDMADKKLDVDDINEMALDYIINTGGLPDSIEALQYCLHKFYEQINKQD